MCWLFVCFFYRRFYYKDGAIGNLYYKVVSKKRRKNRKVQTPLPLIIFSITFLRIFCNSLFKPNNFRLYYTVINCGVPSNLRFSRYSTPPTVHSHLRFPPIHSINQLTINKSINNKNPRQGHYRGFQFTKRRLAFRFQTTIFFDFLQHLISICIFLSETKRTSGVLRVLVRAPAPPPLRLFSLCAKTYLIKFWAVINYQQDMLLLFTTFHSGPPRRMALFVFQFNAQTAFFPSVRIFWPAARVSSRLHNKAPLGLYFFALLSTCRKPKSIIPKKCRFVKCFLCFCLCCSPL